MMHRSRRGRGHLMVRMSWAVQEKEEMVGAQTSGRERLGPTGTPRMVVEGVSEESGQEGGRVGGEERGQMEGVIVHFPGLSSLPKQWKKLVTMGVKSVRIEGEGERMERSSTYAPSLRTEGMERRGRTKKSKTKRKM